MSDNTTPERVEVHQALCRLLRLWKDDPDRLAVAARAWYLAGYADPWAGYEVGPDGQERIDRALYRRNRRVLRHRAEGLLLALEAEAAESGRLRAALPERQASEGEHCDTCGRSYPTVWQAEDALWRAVVGGAGGLRCPECFDSQARAKGYSPYWTCGDRAFALLSAKAGGGFVYVVRSPADDEIHVFTRPEDADAYAAMFEGATASDEPLLDADFVADMRAELEADS